EHWQKKKIKIKEELLRFASEILRIKAERKLVKREPLIFSEEMYERFCEGFELTETPDQLRTIDEVKRDLQREYPMERIVCGDVGFGKTEIILRASFIVASSGFQVAVLVPTTILAEQHFNTFRERMRDFPLRVEMLSRFVNDGKASDIKKDIRDGKVDIVIGTHKILTSSVQFKNLRLLVIDEEHKFGVEQKERLKRENPSLDVLITTATPIPRTLHMGFSSLIDLSVLTTAPQGRIPVRTVIAKYDEEIIRNAILKEVRRGYQIFFVHPRIRTIDTVAKRIKGLLPELRIAIAHGRMPPEKIEEVMSDFYQKKYDLLVSTNIIGAGLDFPDVNTIIVDSSDLFGLSELYQLRGRVGRRKVNAYAYFLFPSVSNLTREVKKKMDILYRHQGLGAGFNIASEDLELRGAGELLGKKQAGFIEGIGFDLYNELLEDALSEIQGNQVKRLPETEIRIDLPVYIPDSYIDDVSIRLNFYHRFSAARSREAVENLLLELKDRFGDYPSEVENLARLSEIKIAARSLGVKSIEKFKNSVNIVFDASAKIDSAKIIPFME
ncbi:MAG: helicase-related protein, partial [Deltaproteobacteria bacterium]|nr:helicase-related protein [Deltaproteobacteria bacterium]